MHDQVSDLAIWLGIGNNPEYICHVTVCLTAISALASLYLQASATVIFLEALACAILSRASPAPCPLDDNQVRWQIDSHS